MQARNVFVSITIFSASGLNFPELIPNLDFEHSIFSYSLPLPRTFFSERICCSIRRKGAHLFTALLSQSFHVAPKLFHVVNYNTSFWMGQYMFIAASSDFYTCPVAETTLHATSSVTSAFQVFNCFHLTAPLLVARYLFLNSFLHYMNSHSEIVITTKR